MSGFTIWQSSVSHLIYLSFYFNRWIFTLLLVFFFKCLVILYLFFYLLYVIYIFRFRLTNIFSSSKSGLDICMCKIFLMSDFYLFSQSPSLYLPSPFPSTWTPLFFPSRWQRGIKGSGPSPVLPAPRHRHHRRITKETLPITATCRLPQG